jgi:DNA-binding transcriptional ArsR family regulator
VTTSPAIAQAAPLFSGLFDALGDANRLRIITRLCDGGPSSITRIAEAIPVSRQAVTKHLLALEAVGLVDSRRQGRERIWIVRTEPLGEASHYLTQLSNRWDRVIERLRAYVETPEGG